MSVLTFQRIVEELRSEICGYFVGFEIPSHLMTKMTPRCHIFAVYRCLSGHQFTLQRSYTLYRAFGNNNDSFWASQEIHLDNFSHG